MTAQPGKQRITIHILLNISRIKDHQPMKFGQLREYPKRNIFLFQCQEFQYRFYKNTFVLTFVMK